MSFFNSTAKIVHSSQLPAGVTREQGIAMLRDHEFFLECDPHLDKFDKAGEVSEPSLPEGIKALGSTTSYKVLDTVDNVPKGIWGSSVESMYEFTDIELGLFARIRSPLNVVMDTIWEIKEGSDGKGLELVEDANIKCSKLLMSIVKSQCEGGWAKIHCKMLERLEKELGGSSANGSAA